MNWIEVTQRIDGELTMVCINANLIDYVKPRIADCSIHFVNGHSIWVAENVGNLKKLLKGRKIT